jgi:hypothetical protein
LGSSGSIPIRSNKSTLLAGIPVWHLPKTFQDAIKICEKIGVRYIWIDSLCIIQDDAEDWRNESGQMAEVYSNSLCNIGATGSADSRGGCFYDRDAAAYEPCKFEIRIGNKSHSFYVAEALVLGRILSEQPLLERAWCLQERLLSPRMVDFTRDQMLWTCQELCACETYPRGIPTTFSQQFRLEREQSPRYDLDPNIHLESLLKRLNSDCRTANSAIAEWTKIVRTYMGCQLSKPEDKLVALSGLARHMHRILQVDYLAGLWRRSLDAQLLWYKPIPLENKVSPYRAPSWSWASVDGDIELRLVREQDDDGGNSEKEPTEEYTKKRTLVGFLEARVSPLSADIFGAVTGGLIRLKASLWQAVLVQWPPQAPWPSLCVKQDSPYTEHSDISLNLDVKAEDADLNEKRIFYAVPLRHVRAPNGTEGTMGLCLEQIDADKQIYRRIGLFQELIITDGHQTTSFAPELGELNIITII